MVFALLFETCNPMIVISGRCQTNINKKPFTHPTNWNSGEQMTRHDEPEYARRLYHVVGI
jgi:hypothetical protein